MNKNPNSVYLTNARYVGTENRESLYDLCIPDNSNGELIIFVHGFMGFKDWGAWHLVQDFFTNKGYAFCKFNLSHNGGTVENGIDFPDELSFGKNTYSFEVEDLVSLTKKISSHFEKVPQIHLIGHSRGGATALLSARTIGAKTLSLWASISSIAARFPSNEELKKWEEEGIRYIQNSRTQQKLPQNFSLYTDYIKNKEKLDLEKASKTLTISVSIFHGEQDNSVDPSEGALLASWVNTDLNLIKNTDHVFGAKHPWLESELPQKLEELCIKTLAFLLKS
jgi:alpha-beta hydrolase superfamily lysophospholipase